MSTTSPCVYLVVSAAPPVLHVEELVRAFHDEGWTVVVIATPTAAAWADLDSLAGATGCLIRVQLRPPREQESLPRADAVVAAPLTFNSINKWAAGISDTLALGVLNEMVGTDAPVLAAPCVKQLLRTHPAYNESITRLTGMGVSIMPPDAITTRADDGLATFLWAKVITALNDLTGRG